MNDELKLRNRLKEARFEKKLSQSQLAEMVGVSRNTISSIETGQFNPTAKLALILCIALDKKFEELFYFLLEFLFCLYIKYQLLLNFGWILFFLLMSFFWLGFCFLWLS